MPQQGSMQAGTGAAHSRRRGRESMLRTAVHLPAAKVQRVYPQSNDVSRRWDRNCRDGK